MKRLALALGLAIGVFALSGTASAQYYRSQGHGGYGHGGQRYGGGGHYHHHQGHYHYHQPRAVYSSPRIYQPYGYPGYGYNRGYSRGYGYPGGGYGYPGGGYGYPGYYGGSSFNFGYARPGVAFGLSFIR